MLICIIHVFSYRLLMRGCTLWGFLCCTVFGRVGISGFGDSVSRAWWICRGFVAGLGLEVGGIGGVGQEYDHGINGNVHVILFSSVPQVLQA